MITTIRPQRPRFDSKEGRVLRAKEKAQLAARMAIYCATSRASVRALAQALNASQQLVYATAKDHGFRFWNDGLTTWVDLPEPAKLPPHQPPEWVQRMRAAPEYRRLVGAF
jgi:hypothetical protein